jgi:Mce-associated membrane protein
MTPKSAMAEELAHAPNDDPAMLAAEAEAEAEAAEAAAEAARARARAIRLRRQAQEAGAATDEVPFAEVTAVHADVDESAAVEPETGEREADGAEAVGDPDLADEPADSGLLPRRRSLRGVLAAGAAALLITALLGISAAILWHHRGVEAGRQRAAEFAAAARLGVVNMTSLDFNNAKEGVQHILDSSTGEFKADFASRATDFVKVVQDSKVVTKGTVNLTAVQSMSKDSAVVLVAATSEVTNSAGAKNDPRSWRLKVTVSRDGDVLKMAKVEFVP